MTLAVRQRGESKGSGTFFGVGLSCSPNFVVPKNEPDPDQGSGFICRRFGAGRIRCGVSVAARTSPDGSCSRLRFRRGAFGIACLRSGIDRVGASVAGTVFAETDRAAAAACAAGSDQRIAGKLVRRGNSNRPAGGRNFAKLLASMAAANGAGIRPGRPRRAAGLEPADDRHRRRTAAGDRRCDNAAPNSLRADTG